MNMFNLVAVLGGLAAIGTFVLGTRAMAHAGAAGQRRGGSSGLTWQSVFTFFVFLTILAAPLSH